jgi:hypothetical protein
MRASRAVLLLVFFGCAADFEGDGERGELSLKRWGGWDKLYVGLSSSFGPYKRERRTSGCEPWQCHYSTKRYTENVDGYVVSARCEPDVCAGLPVTYSGFIDVNPIRIRPTRSGPFQLTVLADVDGEEIEDTFSLNAVDLEWSVVREDLPGDVAGGFSMHVGEDLEICAALVDAGDPETRMTGPCVSAVGGGCPPRMTLHGETVTVGSSANAWRPGDPIESIERRPFGLACMPIHAVATGDAKLALTLWEDLPEERRTEVPITVEP